MQAVKGALWRGEPHLGALARVPSVMNGPPKPKSQILELEKVGILGIRSAPLGSGLQAPGNVLAFLGTHCNICVGLFQGGGNKESLTETFLFGGSGGSTCMGNRVWRPGTLPCSRGGCQGLSWMAHPTWESPSS